MTTVTNAKFEVEKFDGTNNFGMWQCEILDVLYQQELDIALEEKPDNMDDKELNSLPDEYDHLTTTLLHGKDTITFDAVCSALRRSETRKKDKIDHRDTIAEVLIVRGRSRNIKPDRRGKSKGRPAKDECAFCSEKGHWKKNCSKLQKGKAISNACVAEHDEESDFSLVGMAMACHTDEWILDSGCTYHMCPDKDWFSSLKELEGGVVLICNDSAYKTMGVGALESKGLTITLRDGLLKTLAKQDLLKGANSCKLELCKHCVPGKQTRVKFGLTIHNTKEILDYVHSDIWRPTKVASLGGMHYFVTFVDDYSRKVWVYLMKRKNEVLDAFLKWKKMVETQTGRKQNGVAERMNRTILEKVRCMLSNAELGKKFWAEAVTYACHLINRLPSAAINEKTPIEIWTGKSATDYDSLHVFGSTAYYHVKESKLDPRAKKALFLGITDGVKGYRLWCPDTRNIVFSKDVTFDESTMLKYKDSQKDDKTSSTLQQVEFEKVNDDPANIVGTNDKEVPTQESLQQQDSIAYRRPRREIRKPARFDDIVAYALPIADDDVPSTYTEAISNPDGGNKTIGCKRVYAKKEGFLGKNKIRYKARLVVKGYIQKEGIDYNEVFSPVVKHLSIQILLALVEQYDLKLVQLDVKTVFLHGDLEEEIYMTQPDGFKVAGKLGLQTDKVTLWIETISKAVKLQEGTFIYLLLYVDDMLIASKSKVEIERLKTQLNLEFEMKDLGEAKKILGMEIWRDRAHSRVSLSQKQYLRKVIQQFGMNEQTKLVSIPLASHFKLSAQLSPSTNMEREYMLQVPYSNAVVDSDYAGDLDQRRSTTGYVFTFAGRPISWKSTLQSTVALSTTEAEYMAVTEAVKEAIWLQGMVKTLGLVQEHTNVYCDSQSAIHLAKNQVYHARTKHIAVQFHFAKEIIDEGKICL
ncbi:hypothetical protein CXB51_023752 [Gossypium anomalum]|uniref:Integrase catalytic domain-containing protein n=1 Tax=Gossypium anomalum TaxID=47600 RepID=A0A8J5Y953_9ROSI|nr:hypothetical protein CXB51_023752 [Gossypium anomalum]